MILALELEGGRFRAGEVVSGAVVVHQGGSLRELDVLVTYAERTADFMHRHVTVGSGVLYRGDVQGGARFPFAVVLPLATYPNVVTAWGELAWNVEIRADLPWAADPDVRQRIEVDHSVSAAPAGWYPQADGRQRYWDGSRWTEHVSG